MSQFTRPTIRGLINQSIHFSLAFIKARNMTIHLSTLQRGLLRDSQIWLRPPQGCLKINTDGAITFSKNSSAACFVVRDSNGFVVYCECINLGFCSPLVAELWAIKHALSWAKVNDIHSLILESDSLLAI